MSGTQPNPGPVGAREERAEARMRRRFARRQWARRWGVWRPVLAAVLVGALAGLATWVLAFSSVLAVEEVDVRGTDHLTPAEIRTAAAVDLGQPLLRVDLDRIARRVESLAAVSGAEVHRDWPHGVRIVVEERVAVAVAEIGGRMRGMDAEGVVFRDYAKAPRSLPRVRVVGKVDRDALEQAATVLSAMPEELSRNVRRVDVETIDHVSLVLRDDRTVLWGSGESSDDKAAVLAALLEATEAKHYDVSVPGQPVTSG